MEGATGYNMNLTQSDSTWACLCMLLSICNVELDLDLRSVCTAPQIQIELVPLKLPLKVVLNWFRFITHMHEVELESACLSV